MMNIKVRLSSVLLIVAAFVLVFVSFNSFVSAQSGEVGVGDRQLQTDPDGTINYVVPGGPGFVSVSGASFTPMNDAYAFNTMNGYLYNPSSSLGGNYVAQVTLPHGAIVTKFVAYYFDNITEKDLEVNLIRKSFSDIEMNYMAEVVSISANPSVTYWYDDSIQFTTVDNQSNSYFATVWLPSGTISTMCLIGVRVDYTFPSYLPCVTK
jgi:hypothetical protein